MSLTRRKFLLAGSATVGGLVIAWGVLPARSRLGSADLFSNTLEAVALNGWIRIAADDTVSIAMPRAEMGQGVYTALAMLIAEELDCDINKIRIEQAPPASLYGNVAMLVDSLPFHPDAHASKLVKASEWIVGKLARELGLQITGGSSSVKDAWQPMRLAGASAKAMLLAAAASKWGVPAASCVIINGLVQSNSGKSIGIGQLAKEASQHPIPDVELKTPAQFKLIGKPQLRLDAASKTDGSAQFGIDVRLPGMLYAAVQMCPVVGGSLKNFDANAVQNLPGVQRVMGIPPAMGAQAAVAIIAQHYWQAKQAIEKLPVQWDFDRNAGLSTEQIFAELKTALNSKEGWSYFEQGKGQQALEGAARTLSAEYSAPYLAHAVMEPINCTAQLKDGKLTLWVGTQVVGPARLFVGRVVGLDAEDVSIHVKLLGGGFGRRLELDFMAQAALIAKQTDGQPVQVIWTKEQDIRHDMYRPAALARMQAALDEKGKLIALASKQASGSITYDWMRRNIPALASPTPDKTTDEGLFDRPYEIPHQSHRQVSIQSPLPLGFWRSVGHSMNAFFAESFMDECAFAAGKDPYEFRLSLLQQHPRHLKVLETVAKESGWGKPLANGKARGIALHQSFGSIVAQVAEISLEKKQKPQTAPAGALASTLIRVHQVWCAIDCGFAVNPNIIAQQMESSVIFGLSAALFGEITVQDGHIKQSNYHDYQVLRLEQAPVVHTTIIQSNYPPSGVGEPGTPPIAPAIANALFSLTGRRLRTLPLRLDHV
ncbi:MAG: molybdopterin-dependent oxidoreductase [Burkholderiaceae bacterium]|nr:molybdopterin-dependent oxidoreductase [Burkholderiaceae bacterium]